MRGAAASVEHQSFLGSHRVATLIDAGANKGQFSLALRGYWPKARIIAFEPLADPARIFRRVFADDPLVTLDETALGAASHQATIHISRRSHSSSLLPLGLLQKEIFPGTDEIGTQTVDVTTLDAVIDVGKLEHPVLLKIDVQGLELEVLKGAHKSLDAIDHVYVEVSFLPLYEGQALAHEIVAWLAQRGFVLSGIYHIETDRSGRSVQADMHFQRAG